MINSASDVAKLKGAPDSFKDFVPSELRRGQGEFSGGSPYMYVQGLHTDGYALGGFFASGGGGFASAWAIKNGNWQMIWEGQNIPDCAPLRAVRFPAALLAFAGGECLDGSSSVRYGSGSGTSSASSSKTTSAGSGSSGSTAKSCEVSSGMIAALKRKGLSAGSGLNATCAGDWALLSSDEGGDTQMLLRRSGSGWEFYTGFPSNICRAKYLDDGGAPAYASRLRPC